MNYTDEISLIDVVEIHPDCKYVFLVEGERSKEELERFRQQLREFWTNPDHPFVVLKGEEVALRKVADMRLNTSMGR